MRNLLPPVEKEQAFLSIFYAKKGATVVDMNEATLKKWQALARPVWKDFADKNDNCAKLLAMAEKLL